MREKLKEMLELQFTLNSMTNGEKWKDGVTNKWKVINWKRCIYMEMAEAIDSLPWKHWKNVEWKIDFENLRVELVDVWHFLMSELLRLYELDEVMNLVEENMDYEADMKVPKNWTKDDNTNLDGILIPFEALMGMSLLPVESNREFMENVVQEFFVCLDAVGVSFDDLYKLYIGKNVLNKFRQDNWYKEWTYEKTWNGKEDNVYMQEIIEKTSGFENIYEELEKVYKKSS